MSARRLAVAGALALTSLASCSASSEVPADWSRVTFDGGSLALPPTSTADVRPRGDALLSRALVVEGRTAGRLDVYREELPSTDDAPPAAAVAACPGTGDARSEELRPGLDSLNVFDARAPGDGDAVEDDTVVCASFGRDSDERTIQVVVQGPDDVVDESLWRPIITSVRLDG